MPTFSRFRAFSNLATASKYGRILLYTFVAAFALAIMCGSFGIDAGQSLFAEVSGWCFTGLLIVVGFRFLRNRR